MADVAVNTSLHGSREGTGTTFGCYDRAQCFGPVWTSDQNGYLFFITDAGSGPQVYYSKTTNGGTSWGAATLFYSSGESTNGIARFAVWFDQWTTGDSGTKVHLAAMNFNDNNVYYRALDTADDSLGSSVNAFGLTDIAAGDWFNCGWCSITKARGGNLYILAMANGAGTLRRGFYRSTDSGASWSSRTVTTIIDEADDQALILPANTSDNQDIVAIKMDESANQVEARCYDDSANTWSSGVSCFSVSGGDWTDDQWGFDAMVRHSDGKIVVVGWNNAPASTADIKCSEITVSTTTPSNSAKTDVVTNLNNAHVASLFINQATNDLYVFVAQGTTYPGTVDVKYYKSTDSASSWGSAQTYSQDASDDIRMISAGRSVKSGQSGRASAGWVNTDLQDLFFNAANSVSITGGSAQTVDMRGAIAHDREGTLTVVPGQVDIGLRGAFEQARAGALTLVPGAILVDLRGALEGMRAGALTIAASFQADLRGAIEQESAGALATVPGTASVPLLGAQEGLRAGATTLSPGQVDIGLLGAAERDAAGALTATVGALTVDLRGAAEGDQAGMLTPSPGQVDLALRGIVEGEQDGAAALAPGQVDLALAGGREQDWSGALALAATVSIDLRGASEGERAGTLTLVPGAVTIDLRGASERDRTGTLEIATAPAQQVDLAGAREGDWAGTSQVTPGGTLVDLRGAWEGDRAGTGSLAPGGVTINLAGERTMELIGALALAPDVITAFMAGAREGERAGALAWTAGQADIQLRAATEGERSGATSLAPGAVTLDLRGAVVQDRAGTITPFEGGITITVDLRAGIEVVSGGAVLAVVGASVQISGPTKITLVDDGRRTVSLTDDGRRTVRLLL